MQAVLLLIFTANCGAMLLSSHSASADVADTSDMLHSSAGRKFFLIIQMNNIYDRLIDSMI